MPVTGAECSFLDVIGVDPDLVVPPPQVDLGEDLGSKEAVSEVVDERDGEMVLDGDVVEGPVVDAHVQGSILFLDEDDWGAKRGHAGLDRAVLEESVQFFTHGVEFEGGESINGSPGGWMSRFEGDVVINVAFRGKAKGEF